MKQIEENKEELLEMIEQLAHEELSPDIIRNLDTLWGAYSAVCLVHREKHLDHKRVKNSMTEQEAESWVSRMRNADGSVGAHWPMDKTEQARTQREINCDPVKFWVAMNMMYSDYCEVAKKNHASTVDFFVDMAKAFLDDADARPDKLERYYECVAEG